jgi:hypothetical protein
MLSNVLMLKCTTKNKIIKQKLDLSRCNREKEGEAKIICYEKNTSITFCSCCSLYNSL